MKIEIYRQNFEDLAQISVRSGFFRQPNNIVEKGYVTLKIVIWWVKWDEILDSITYVEKLDRFIKSTYMW
jgi:hypothetical protein